MALTYEELTPQFKENFNDWISYYRLNVHRFIQEYFGVELKDFQKILIYCMSKPNFESISVFDFFASRGLGKSFLTMVFAMAMATLYPGIKIVVASASVKTAQEFMNKIKILQEYPNIAQEIKKDGIHFTKEESSIELKNSSMILSKVCNENARGSRSQILIFDEKNIMDSSIISRVFDYFLTEKRDIPAYRNPKYKKYKKYEHNYRISLTSIGYSDDDAYKEFQANAAKMASGDKRYDTFSLPYQFGIESGIIDKSFMLMQAEKSSSNIEDFQSEAEVIPIGTSENAIFNHIEINRSRQIVIPLIEPTIKQYIENHGILKDIPTYVPKQRGEMRVMSIDIATAMGRKNDASAWTIYRLFDKGDYYDKHVSFHRAINGMNIDAQNLYTKRLWHYFDIDYIVIDAGGAIGIAFATLLGAVTVDMQLGNTYPGFRTMNMSEKYDIRVADEGAIPILYCMQVSGAGASQMQADMSFISKVNFERNRIFMLVDDVEGIDELNDRYKYMKLKTSNNFAERDIAENMVISFMNTNELVHEMLSVKLKKLPSGRYTLEEGSGERKDRLISLLYGCYFIDKLEQDLKIIERKKDISLYARNIHMNMQSGVKNPFAGRSGFKNGFGQRR